MVQGYYTLQEAADYLDMSLDELKQMAQKGKIRSFQDRGTLRFRIQDIQELARKRGAASDPDLVLNEPPPAPKSGVSSGTKRKAPASPKSPKQKQSPEVFAFDLDDSVDVGADVIPPKSGPKKAGEKSDKKPHPPVSPPIPTAGSDSDVRLVADGSDVTFSVPKEAAKIPDSDVKISPDPLKPKSGIHAPSSGSKRPSQLALDSGKVKSPSSAAKQDSPRPGSGSLPRDSGVRLVPLSDSDVKLVGSSDEVALGDGDNPTATDSNVRLEKVKLPPADSGEGMLLTEEINLDEEIRKQQEQQKKSQSPAKIKVKSEVKLPTSSPFELSDSGLELPSELKHDAGPKTPVKEELADADDGSGSSDFDLTPQAKDSSDFDLVPSGDDGTVLTEGESSDFSLDASEGDQVLDEQQTELTGATSGISLNNPVDAGISLEDDVSNEFDLSLEVDATPRPSPSQPVEDSGSDFDLSPSTPKPGQSMPVEESGEFDLSLDSSADAPIEAAQDDSAFDLNLEGSDEGTAIGESDSEFELTLDDSGNLEVQEEEAPQVKKKKTVAKKKGDDQDIFESDFDVPQLDASDEATVADSELESSDFDLALDDSELAQDEESGSQVVALDEEDADTVADSDAGAAVVDDVDVEEESSDFADLDQDVEVEDDVEVEEDAETKVRVKTEIVEKLIEPAPWGILPVIFMLPCVIIMFFVALIGFEMVQSTAGAKPPGPLTVGLAEMLPGAKITVK
jgi:excisionase family DNA binding protein